MTKRESGRSRALARRRSGTRGPFAEDPEFSELVAARSDVARAGRLDAWRRLTRVALRAQKAGNLADLEAATGHDESTLRAFANVARWIDEEQWNALISWRDVNGRHLTRWHITYLASKSAAARTGLLSEMRRGIWRAVKIRQWGRARSWDVPRSTVEAR